MVSAIANFPSYSSLNSNSPISASTAGSAAPAVNTSVSTSASSVGASASSSSADTSVTSQEALLESELAVYTQQLAEASSGDGSNAPGALNAQQLQQQIASIQQQLNQLSGTVYTPTSFSYSTSNFINTFA